MEFLKNLRISWRHRSLFDIATFRTQEKSPLFLVDDDLMNTSLIVPLFTFSVNPAGAWIGAVGGKRSGSKAFEQSDDFSAEVATHNRQVQKKQFVKQQNVNNVKLTSVASDPRVFRIICIALLVDTKAIRAEMPLLLLIHFALCVYVRKNCVKKKTVEWVRIPRFGIIARYRLCQHRFLWLQWNNAMECNPTAIISIPHLEDRIKCACSLKGDIPEAQHNADPCIMAHYHSCKSTNPVMETTGITQLFK